MRTGFAPARLGPPLTALILLAPVLFGLAGTFLPAFGYLPALGGSGFSLDPVRDLVSQPAILRSSLISLWTGLATTVLSLSVVVLFVGSWRGTLYFRRMAATISPLLAIPHAAAAFGLAFLIAPSGFLIRLISPQLTGFDRPPDVLIVHDGLGLTMIAGLIVKEIPFLFLVTLSAMTQIRSEETRRLAASMGYGRVVGFVFFEWPQIYRQIRLAVFAVVAFSTSVADVSLILGPTLPGTLSVRLITWMNDPDLTGRFMASAGAVLQLLITCLALLLWLLGEKCVAMVVRLLRDKGRRLRRDGYARAIGLAMMLCAAAAVFGGLVVLALWSVAGLWAFPETMPKSFTMANWARALPGIGEPLAVTVVTGLLATLIALFLTIACLEREWEVGRGVGNRALFFIYLPLIIPQLSFVFGLQVLAVSMGLDASFTALVGVHLVFVLPYVFLSLADPWRAFDARYDHIAAGLGQSRRRVLLRIRLPMLLRAVLTAAAVGFSVSVAQYLPTLLIGAGRLTTVTSEAVALASGGNRRIIGIYALLQSLLPFVGFVIAYGVPALLFRHRRALRH